MARWIVMSALAGAIALPLVIAPAAATASCSDRKTTGTVVGGVGGALIGNSIVGGGGGAILGGLGGAVLGHEVARDSCGRYRRAEYRRPYGHHEYGRGAYQGGGGPMQGQPGGQVYYDHRGNPIGQGSAPTTAYAVAGAPACAAQAQPYYNDRGELVQPPVSTCGR